MATSTETASLVLKADATEITKGSEALDKLTVSAEGASKSVDKLAESEDQAKARIRAMVQASMEKVKAQNESIASGQREVQMTDAQRAAIDKLNKASNTQADMNARGAALMAAEERSRKAATIGVAEQTGALSKLLGQIDPTIAGYERLDAMQAKLAAFRKSGAISGDDYTLFSGKIAGMRQELEKAGTATHTLTLNSSMARRELGRMGTDIAMGNYGRLTQTSLTLANYTGVMGKVFSSTGLAIGGAAAILGIFAKAAYEAYSEEQKLNQAIAITGNFAGTTVGQIGGLAASFGVANGKVGLAKDILLALAANGKVGSEAYAALGQAAFDMAALTGDSADKAAASVAQMFDGTAAGALKANEQYHFLTDATYDQIKALEDEGKTQEAVRVTAEAFHDSIGPRLDTMQSQVYGLAKAWGSVATATRGWWQEFKSGAALIAGTADISSQYYAQFAKVQTEIQHFGKPSFGQQEKLDRLKAQKDAAEAAAEVAAAQSKINDQAISGDAAIDRLSASVDKADAKKQKLAELSAAFEKLWGSADPSNKRLAGVQRLVGDDGTVSFVGGEYDRLKAGIEAKYAERAVKEKKAPDLSINPPDDFLSKITDGYKKDLDAQAKATIALEDYRQVQEAKLRTSQEALDLQVKSIGMGDREIAMEREIISIHREADQDLQRLNKQRSSMTQDQYDAQLAIIKEFEDRRVAAAHDADERIRAAQSQWQNGFTRAFDNYVDQAGDVAGQSAELFTNAFNGMSDSLANFATTGKMNFKGLVTSILSDLAKMEMRIAMSKILQQVVGMFVGGYDSSGGAGTSSYNSMGGVSHVNFGANAMGGVYTSPSLSAYSGQIVNQPTAFKFASGAGIMGEAGPEAIMPLSRGSDGKLGVKAAGGGGDINIPISITVDANGSAKSQTAPGNSDAMARALAAQMKQAATEVVQRAMQPGGILWKQRVGA